MTFSITSRFLVGSAAGLGTWPDRLHDIVQNSNVQNVLAMAEKLTIEVAPPRSKKTGPAVRGGYLTDVQAQRNQPARWQNSSDDGEWLCRLASADRWPCQRP